MGAAISLYETEVEAQPEFNRSVPTGAVGTLNSRESDRSSSTSKDSKAAAHQSSTANPRLSPHAGPGTLLPVDAVAGIVAAHGGARNGTERRPSKLKTGHALMHALPDLQPIEAQTGDPLPGARHIILISTVLTTDARAPGGYRVYQELALLPLGPKVQARDRSLRSQVVAHYARHDGRWPRLASYALDPQVAGI